MIDLETVQKLPDQPGVYFFKDEVGKILYIGKATSLRNRVKSYLSKDLLNSRGMLLVKMVETAKSIEYVATDSVLEALILEAVLIKKHQPFHNTREKDDKTHNFVVFTNENFPQILVVRERELEQKYIDPNTYKAVYGPFPNGSSLRIAMKIIRRIFPYRDAKCVPAEEQVRMRKIKTSSKNLRPCFNRQIGLCPGVCTGEVDQKEYGKIVKHLMMFFEGQKKALVKSLEKEMKDLAKKKEFERAEKVKRTVFALQHIQDVALIGKDGSDGNDTGRGGQVGLSKNRIEAYDISHMSGKSTVGVMTVVENGEAAPAEYRMFKIRQQNGNDDLRSLAEVLTRRFGHPEWPWPVLIVIDGGKTHMEHAAAHLKNLNIEVPVVSVVKDDRHQPRDVLTRDEDMKNVQTESLVATFRREILLANSEAHRFAIKYHRRVRNRVQLL
jgi:excinuclease ABC subunit C